MGQPFAMHATSLGTRHSNARQGDMTVAPEAVVVEGSLEVEETKAQVDRQAAVLAGMEAIIVRQWRCISP